jgi:hypothetical protein
MANSRHILKLTTLEQKVKPHRRSKLDFLVSFAGRLTHLHASLLGYLKSFAETTTGTDRTKKILHDVSEKDEINGTCISNVCRSLGGGII